MRLRAIGFIVLANLILVLAWSATRPVLATPTSEATTSNRCSQVGTCAFFENGGSGSGVAGTSLLGPGIIGRTYGSAASVAGAVVGLELGTSVDGTIAGVYGQGSGADPGVIGQGYSGVVGLGSAAGVYGMATPTNPSIHTGFGVAGIGRTGVEGIGAGEPGIFGINELGVGPDANGLEALAPASAGLLSYGATGVIAVSMAGSSTIPSGTNAALKLEVYNDTTQLLRGTDQTGHDVVSLDAAGNLILAGTLTQQGTPAIATRGNDGSTKLAFGARTTQPAIEDVGEARLTNGSAYVPLDRDFAATIDPNAPYLAFVTAEGDTRGLYVAQRGSGGFTVRENSGGRSNAAFEYRIVGKPYDTASARLPSPATRPHLDTRIFPRHHTDLTPVAPPARPAMLH